MRAAVFAVLAYAVLAVALPSAKIATDVLDYEQLEQLTHEQLGQLTEQFGQLTDEQLGQLTEQFGQLTQEEIGQLKEEDRSGWQTYNALLNWMRPLTNYITQRLPEKTPVEFAKDVQDAAVDLKDRAVNHPVVQGVSRVLRPVHEWVKDKATALGRTSFRDIYDSAASSVQSADERVGQWLNNRSQQLNSVPEGEVQILE